MSNECMSLAPGPVKTCRHCGKKFVAEQVNCVYCSDTCKREHYREYHKNYQKELRQGQKSGPRALPRSRSLAEVSRRAKACGMTYGQYVSKMRRAGHE